MVRRVIHLRTHHAAETTPLATYFFHGSATKLSSRNISSVLKAAVTFLGPQLGFTADHVSARSLRSAGAMALFNMKVDALTIRLIGRWRSDEMLRYLSTQCEPVMRGLSRKMIQAANEYTLIPGTLSHPFSPPSLLPPNPSSCLGTPDHMPMSILSWTTARNIRSGGRENIKGCLSQI
mmetsp:Transcript_4318/g.4892  ORF Transcript_4318/g.4892 Transcript_4318/m.4892 type:complete len:178 (-) Transcript_4318:283-816(-)